MNLTLSGAAELEKRLIELGANGVIRAGKKALRAGVKRTSQAVKDRIPARMKDARKAIGSSVKGSGSEIVAKAGAAVGITKARAEKAKQKRGARTRPGEGISARNIHWLVAGTKQRFKKSGVATGVMKPMPVVQEAWSAVQSEVETTISDTFMAEIQKEAQL